VLTDPSLVGSVLRLDAAAVLRDGDMLGRLIETFVLAQLQAEAPYCLSRPRLHHLRQADGRHEIDVVAELGGGRVLALEIKATAAPRADDARHLRWLREHLDDRFVAGVVLHTGPSAFELDERIAALPISTMWA
jgi:predicted AAA+ superfamily ATPase